MGDADARLDAMLGELGERHPGWVVAGRWIDVPTQHEERRQRIRIQQVGEHWELTSIVLHAQVVTRTMRRWRELAVRAWLRNDATNIVTFTFDEKDRLIGIVRHPVAHLDLEELQLYVTVLAAECDRFEYLLGGIDVS